MNDFFNVTNNIDIVIKCIIIIFTQITCYKIINDNKYITISNRTISPNKLRVVAKFFIEFISFPLL